MKPSESRAFINQLVIYTLVMICLSGSIGLATVWMRHQISVTANATRQGDAQITEAERRIADVTIEITEEQTPDALERRNKLWHLGLVAPVETQMVWVPGSPEQRLAELRNQALFRSERIGLDSREKPPSVLSR